MHPELTLAIVAILSWTTATFFTDGVEVIADNFLEKAHNKATVYFSFALLFLFLTVWVSIKYK